MKSMCMLALLFLVQYSWMKNYILETEDLGNHDYVNPAKEIPFYVECSTAIFSKQMKGFGGLKQKKMKCYYPEPTAGEGLYGIFGLIELPKETMDQCRTYDKDSLGKYCGCRVDSECEDYCMKGECMKKMWGCDGDPGKFCKINR